jgi:hypothetical protein
LIITAAVIILMNLIAVSYLLYVILPMLKALFLILINVIYGFSAMKLVSRENLDDHEPVPFIYVFSIGLIFTTLFFFLASFLKILDTPVLILYYILPLLLLPLLLKKQGAAFTLSLKSFLQRPAVEYLVFLFPLIYAALPSSFYDTLAYHLGIPNLYLQNGGFIETPQLFYANTFIYYEISSIPAVFTGDMVPRLFHLLIGVILVLSVIDFAVDYFKITKRYVLLLTIVSMPMTIFLMTAVKNDLPCALFILAGIMSFQKDRKLLSAVFWGFAIGVKYTNIIPLGLFLLFQFILSVKEKRSTIFLKQMVVFGLIITGILMPLLVKNYLYTGNPVFPFLYRNFDNRLTYWDTTRLDALKKDAKKVFYSVGDVLKFPFTLSFDELGSGGRVGPLFLMFLPFLFFKRKKKVYLLLFALATLLLGANFKLSTRVWYIAFLLLSIYVTMAYESLEGAARKIMTGLFFIVIAFNLFNSFGLHEYLYRSHDLFTGKVSIEEYKGLAFPAYKAIAYVNDNTPQGARVLVVGEGKSYYLKRPYFVSSGYDYSILKKYLEKSRYPGDFIAALKADGIRYIIFDSVEFKRLQSGYNRLSAEEFNRAISYLRQMPVLFNEDEVLVLEIL